MFSKSTATNVNLEILGRTSSFRMDGAPAIYFPENIAFEKASVGVSSDFVLSWVLAHEAGHKFGLLHPERSGGCGSPVCCSYVPIPIPLSSLTLSQFSIDSSNNTKLLLKLQYESDNRPGVQPDEFPTERAYLDLVTADLYPNDRVRVSQDSINRQHVFSLFFAPTTITSTTPVAVYKQIGSIMDWTYDRNRTDANLTQFSTIQLNDICTHGRCGQQ